MRTHPSLKFAAPKSRRLFYGRVGALFLILLMSGASLFAYSVLTHEEIVDLAWTDEIQPLLLARYPGLTEVQIRDAHAYAYGGAVIQDLGYYPFGSTEFSDLVHYVRSGDFVLELLHESKDANEYAFALGALSHYASDIAGHPVVNMAVAIAYPKLRAKFGRSVLYAQDQTAHIKTEFGFDMAQVAKQRYASQQYHDFIGFQVSKPLLERVFPVVYGMKLEDVLTREDLAIATFRYSVGSIIPHMTQVALQTHKKDIMRETPSFAKRKFLYRLSRSEYEKEWGKDYQKPGLGTRVLSTLLHFIPKIGPFKGMGFKNPTSQTENMYFVSINLTVDRYKALLQAERAGSIVLPNDDLDSGNATIAAEYSLADEAYAKLLAQLADRKFNLTSKELSTNILGFYSDLSAAIDTKRDPERWQKSLVELDQLRLATPVPIALITPIEPSLPMPGVARVPAVPNAIVVGFLGGFVNRDNLVHSEVQLAVRLRKAHPSAVKVETFENYNEDEARENILKFLDANRDGTLTKAEKRNARIIIYGHSWGGSAAITLARELQQRDIPVLLTVQVDSISKAHRDDAIIPANVANAANFYQAGGLFHGEPKIRAADPTRTSIIGNFLFDYSASPYNCGTYPWYDRIVSKSHTQIECDPDVWAKVEALIGPQLSIIESGTGQ